MNLDELEIRLKHRRTAGAGVALRSRVLSAVDSELRRPGSTWWSYAAAAAAALIVGANLALTAASATTFVHAPAPMAAEIQQVDHLIVQLNQGSLP
jgi:hypothetical protein